MGIGLYLTGRYTKRNVLARLPAPEAWLQRVEAWLKDHCSDTLFSTWQGQDDEGRPALSVQLHPSAEPAEITAAGRGRLIVSAKTSTTGPGYHFYFCELLHALGADCGAAWDPPDDKEGTGDETGYFHHGDPQAVEREMLTWLQSLARLTLKDSGKRQSSYPGAWCMPLDHRYQAEGAVCTPLGPRDRRWLEETADDPLRGIDFFSWWQEGQGAPYHLGRALCLMWREARWRPPFNEHETEVLTSVAQSLRAAYELDPSLNYPWREWHEILGYLGQQGQLATTIARQAEQSRDQPLIGYRRCPVIAVLSNGWSIEVPGSFAECWDPDGTWQAWDSRRSVSLTSLSFAANRRPPSAEEAIEGLQLSVGTERELLEHRRGTVIGRGVVGSRSEEGESYWMLQAGSAVAGALAIVTICFDDPSDRRWAIDTWHSLSH